MIAEDCLPPAVAKPPRSWERLLLAGPDGRGTWSRGGRYAGRGTPGPSRSAGWEGQW